MAKQQMADHSAGTTNSLATRLWLAFKSRVLLVFWGLLLLQLVALAAHASPPRWLLRDDDTSIILLSTVHVLSPGSNWMKGTLQADFAASDALILELAPDQRRAEIVQPLVNQYARLPGNRSLMGLLDPATRGDLVDVLDTLGIAPTQVATLRPWFASVVISQNAFAASGFESASGVEATLTERAQRLQIPVRGLESMADQIALFAGLDVTAEIALLQDTLDQAPEADTFLRALSAAWQQGDLPRLEVLLLEPLADSPGLYQRVFVSRNQRWADQVARLLDQPGVYTVAVGAGHFVGPANLRDLLEARGLTLNRLR